MASRPSNTDQAGERGFTNRDDVLRMKEEIKVKITISYYHSS
jgi:hypothetical protein